MNIFEYIETIPQQDKTISKWMVFKNWMVEHPLIYSLSWPAGFFISVFILIPLSWVGLISGGLPAVSVFMVSLISHMCVMCSIEEHEKFYAENRPANDHLKKQVVEMLRKLSSQDDIKGLCQNYLQLLNQDISVYWWKRFLVLGEEHLNQIPEYVKQHEEISVEQSIALLEEQLEQSDTIIFSRAKVL